MRLPCLREKLLRLNTEELMIAILERRMAIRAHRDAKGDDRCWLDDAILWLFLHDTPDLPPVPPPFELGMELCTRFYELRRAEEPDPIPPDAILDRDLWDADLKGMTNTQLLNELVKLQLAIRAHRNLIFSLAKDRALYAVLPEKIPADFRLPPREEFLGEAKAPNAGCPSFWRSHQKCSVSCNLHRWGPCR